MRPAVILLSGGLDSTTTLAMAIDQGYTPYAVTFQYGQRHKFEIEAARKVAERYRVSTHRVFPLNLDIFGGSALTSDIEVPKLRSADAIGTGVPNTYVLARNTVFLSVALAWAEVIPAYDIFIGVNARDYSGYPDCRPEFIEAFARTANLATKVGVENDNPFRIHTPLIDLGKDEIIRRGLALEVDYGLTSTCYDPTPTGEACGACDACLLRLQGFAMNDLNDPIAYASVVDPTGRRR